MKSYIYLLFCIPITIYSCKDSGTCKNQSKVNDKNIFELNNKEIVNLLQEKISLDPKILKELNQNIPIDKIKIIAEKIEKTISNVNDIYIKTERIKNIKYNINTELQAILDNILKSQEYYNKLQKISKNNLTMVEAIKITTREKVINTIENVNNEKLGEIIKNEIKKIKKKCVTE